MLCVAVGVMVYNEEKNLGPLLDLLGRSQSPSLRLSAIVVVSSGSTDASVPIARARAAVDPRVHVIDDHERRGKATAINQFLAHVADEVDICVLSSGDVLPGEAALQRLVEPFADPSVGMTGAHPVPTNRGASAVDRMVRLQWELHHRISLRAPKMGELIAFRRDIPRLDPETAVDEAYIEAMVRGRGQDVVYVPGAEVFNHGPTNLREFVSQRRRIWAGHCFLRRDTGYVVSTMRTANVARSALDYVRASPRQLPLVATATAVELFARGFGAVDALVLGRNPFIWDALPSTKRPETPLVRSTRRAPTERSTARVALASKASVTGTRLLRDRGGALRFLFALWLLQSAAFFVPPATWNPVSRFGLTRAIVERLELELGDMAAATGDRALVAGRWYSDKSPIPSLVAAPAYALVRGVHLVLHRPPPEFAATSSGGLPGVHVTVNRSFRQLLFACTFVVGAVPFALLGWMLLGFLLRRHGPAAAVVAATFTMLGTPLLPYATSFYGHVLAACALFAAVYVTDEAVSDRRLAAAGCALGLASATEFITLLPAIAIGLSIGLRGDGSRSRRVAIMALFALGPLGVVAAYDAICFGAPWRTGYSFVTNPVFVAGHARGLMGLSLPGPRALWQSLFGVERGLLLVSPVAAFGLWGVASAARRRDRAALALGAAFVVLILANAGYYMWWGGAATGPRHVVPALAALGAGIAACLERPRLRVAVWIAGLVSVGVMVGFTAVGIEAPHQSDVLREYLWSRLRRGDIASLAGASNLGIEMGLPRAGSLGPLFAWWTLGAEVLADRCRGMHNAARRVAGVPPTN